MGSLAISVCESNEETIYLVSVPLERTKKRNNKLQMSLMVNTEHGAAHKPEAGSFNTRAWGKHLEMERASTWVFFP